MAETPQTVVYVSNAGSKEIFVFAMDRDSGDLRRDRAGRGARHRQAVADQHPDGGQPRPSVSLCRAAQRAFPASSFAIDRESGRLTHLGPAPLADSMAYIVTDRTGRFLLSASYPGAKLAINPIDGAGRVGERTTQVLATAAQGALRRRRRVEPLCLLHQPRRRHHHAAAVRRRARARWRRTSPPSICDQAQCRAAASGVSPERPLSLSA